MGLAEPVCADPVEPELVDPDELVLGAALVLVVVGLRFASAGS
jgi:hypothetical protein